MNKVTENLSVLKINKLSQQQYDNALEAGDIMENELYLIPDDGTNSSNIEIVDNLTTDDSTKALSARQGKLLRDDLSDLHSQMQGELLWKEDVNRKILSAEETELVENGDNTPMFSSYYSAEATKEYVKKYNQDSVVNDLTSVSAINPLSARQGKILNDKIEEINEQLANFEGGTIDENLVDVIEDFKKIAEHLPYDSTIDETVGNSSLKESGSSDNTTTRTLASSITGHMQYMTKETMFRDNDVIYGIYDKGAQVAAYYGDVVDICIEFRKIAAWPNSSTLVKSFKTSIVSKGTDSTSSTGYLFPVTISRDDLKDVPDEFLLGIRTLTLNSDGTKYIALTLSYNPDTIHHDKNREYGLLGERKYHRNVGLYVTNGNADLVNYAETNTNGNWLSSDFLFITGVKKDYSQMCDSTLTKEGKFAEAKAVGDALNNISTAKLVLPEKFDLVVDDEFELFKRGVVNCVNPDVYDWEFEFDDGNKSRGYNFERKYVFKPTSDLAGKQFTATITLRDNSGKECDKKSVIFNIVPKPTNETISATIEKPAAVLCMGASLVGNGHFPHELHRRLVGTTEYYNGCPTGYGLSNVKFIGNRTKKNNIYRIDGSFDVSMVSQFDTFIDSEKHEWEVLYAEVNGANLSKYKLLKILNREDEDITLPTEGVLTKKGYPWITISYTSTTKITELITNYEGTGGYTFASYISNGEKHTHVKIYPTEGTTFNTEGLVQHNTFTVQGLTSTWKLESFSETEIYLVYSSGNNNIPASGTLVLDSDSNIIIEYGSIEWSTHNPFWDYNLSRNNFKQYAEEQGINIENGEEITHVIILLGWNSTGTTETNYKSNIRTFLNSLFDETYGFPNCKVTLLGLQAPCRDGLGQNYYIGWNYWDTLQHVWNLQQWYTDISKEYQSNGKNVEYVNVSGQFDSEYNSELWNRRANNRNSIRLQLGGNGIHPAPQGYMQIADAALRNICTKL